MRSTRSTWIRFGAAWLLATTGCGFASDDSSRVDPGYVCSRNSECPSGSTCQDGLCKTLSVAEGELEVGWVVSIAGDVADTEPPLVATFVPSPIVGAEERTLSMPLSADVFGRITMGGEPGVASLHFVPQGKIPGLRSRTIQVNTLAEAFEAVDGSDADFRVRLLRGVRYDVYVEPRGELTAQVPPFWTTFEAEAAFDRLNFDLSAHVEDAIVERIRLLRLPADAVTRVRVVDPQTGRVASTVHMLEGVSEAEVTLRMVPGLSTYDIRLAPLPVSDTTGGGMMEARPVLPTLVMPVAALPLGEGGALQLRVPEWPAPVVYRASVDYTCAGSEYTGDPSLPITLRSLSLDVDSLPESAGVTYTGTTTTLGGSLGEAILDVALVPGTYELTIAPPVDSACGVLTQTIHTDAQDDVLVLEPATVLEGMVYRQTRGSDERMGFAGATLEATALTTGQAASHRSTHGATQEDGRFAIPFDAGHYDLIVKPPSASGFGWQVVYDVAISSAPPMAQIGLDAPVPVTGRLRVANRYADAGADPSQWAGATVTAYAMVGTDDAKRPVMIGSAMVNQAGRFDVLLSPTTRRGL